MNRFLLSILIALFVTGCNNNEESSAYSEILDQPPYQTVTDSIKREPGRDELYFRRAVLLNKNNYPEPALADFKKAWSLKKREEYAVAISNLLLEKNNDEAILFLLEALKELPQSIFLQLTLARAYDAENKIPEALTVCQAILEEQPDQINTLLLQSELLQKKGDSSSAIVSLEKAHHLVPANLELTYRLLYLYAEDKDNRTVSLADSLIAADSLKMHADPYYVKGVYYSNIDNKEAAIEWFDKTIKQNYNYLNAYIEKGKILLDEKKVADALATFRLANTISPTFADSWYWIARCQEEMGNKEEAKLNYQKAFGLDPTYIEAKEAAQSIK